MIYTCERWVLCQALSSIIMPGLQLREHRLLCTGDDITIMLMTYWPFHFTLFTASAWMIHCMSPLQLHRWHSPSAWIVFLSIRIAYKLTCCHNTGRGTTWNGGLTTKWQEFDFLIFSAKCNMNLKHQWKLQWIIQFSKWKMKEQDFYCYKSHKSTVPL